MEDFPPWGILAVEVKLDVFELMTLGGNGRICRSVGMAFAVLSLVLHPSYARLIRGSRLSGSRGYN